MEHPRPMLPTQRFSPPPVYGYEHSSRRPGGARQPLRESTGNAQHLGGLISQGSSLPLASQTSCRPPSLGMFSPSLPPTMPTPVVPSQAGAIYRGGMMGAVRTRVDPLRMSRRSRPDINPIYFAPEFRPYRDKQDQKDPNEKQIWPRVLEDAFLDSLLIIPHMGRKKYSMQGKQYGRNMLISEYLWIAYCSSLHGQKAEERKRKQVSSHIQVVKKMFEKHRCYHFFFVKDADKSEARLKESNAEIASFKDNPVLIALSENRLPDVKPNYDYFAQILNMDSLVVMRPKTAWIFVSSSDVTIDEAAGKAFDRNGKEIDTDIYPHIEKNLQKESDGGFVRGLGGNGVLLHEYNRELAQKESAAATEISQEWETKFPSLHRSLELATSDNLWLDMLEMTVTLELHPRSNFPSGSELNGFVGLSIGQPQLQNHRWKCVTRLQRPEELCRAGDEPEPLLVEQTSEVGVQYMHRPGCGGGENSRVGLECDCRTRPRQDVRVPFPAAEWASILSNCASYLQEPLDPKSRADGVSSEEIKASEEAAIESERTAAELIQQIAMFQELWSAPPDSMSSDRRKWTRRGVILWKFRTVHAFDDKWNPIYEKPSAAKGRKPADTDSETGSTSSSRRGGRPKRVYHPPGTTWRFLTALDPISPDHQQNVCVNPATHHHGGLSHRDMVMAAPSPHYSHHFATMNDNMNSPWDQVALPGQLPSMPSNSTLNLMDNYSGLATPPPTASLHSSYAPSFDGNHDHTSQQQQPSQGQHQIDFLTACTTSIDTQSTLVADTSADPFLSATGGMNVGASMTTVDSYDDADFAGAGAQSWDATTAAASFNSLDQWNTWDPSNDGHKTSSAGAAPQAQQWHHDAQRWSAGDAKDTTQIWNQQPWATTAGQVPATTASTGWADMDQHQHQQHHQQRVLPSLNQISPLKGMAGRKRARSNSLDMENRENFPATAIQKLVHHGPGMLDDGQGHHHRWD